METPGRLMPLFSPRSPLFRTLTSLLRSVISMTSRPIRPSSTRMRVADAQVAGKTGVGHGDAILAADHGLVGGEGEGLAGHQGDVVAAFQLDGTGFPALGVQGWLLALPVSGMTARRLLMRPTVFGVVAVGRSSGA